MKRCCLYLLVCGRGISCVYTVGDVFSADSTLLGMVVGLIIRNLPGTFIQKSVSFDYQFFFNLLLPPIILASGYELHQVSVVSCLIGLLFRGKYVFVLFC